MKIDIVGIVGQGFVGKALLSAFSPFYKVYTYDKHKPEESTHNSIESLSRSCNLIFICVPTPMKENGSCDISIVKETTLACCGTGRQNIIAIKSTVPPNTTKSLQALCIDSQIVFNPEFLLERQAEEDFKNTSRIILGGPRPATTRLKQFYSNIFPEADIIKTDSTIAEMVKYLTNSFLAVKVSFANEIYAICKSLGVDYDKVLEYAVYDERIGKSHWSVPGPDGHLGFGGSCFPKDINALIHLAQTLCIKANTIQGAWNTNLMARPEKDWELLKGRAVVDKEEIKRGVS
jgi:nucleotide sugar dehydrogenase